MTDIQTPLPATQTIVFPSEDDVYDALMSDIEPELLTGNLSQLDDAYPDETEEQKKIRYERYADAFSQYDSAYAKWEKKLKEAVADYRRIALKSAEAEEEIAESDILQKLEADITDDQPAPAIS